MSYAEMVYAELFKTEVDAQKRIEENLRYNGNNDRTSIPYYGGTKRSIWAGPDKVALVVSQRNINVRGSRSWTSWHTVQSLGFFRNKAGNLQPYNSCKAPKGKKWTAEHVDQVWDMLDPNFDKGSETYREMVGGTVAQVFREQCNYMLGISDFTDLYPWAKEYGIIHYKYLPKHLRLAYRAKSTPEFATRIFGKKRSNASLMWALKKSDPFFIHMAHSLRNTVEDDRLKFILQNEFDPSELKINSDYVHKMDLTYATGHIPAKIWNNLASSPITAEGLSSIVRISRAPSLAVASLEGNVSSKDFLDKDPEALLEENAGYFKDWTRLTSAGTSLRTGGLITYNRGSNTTMLSSRARGTHPVTNSTATTRTLTLAP